jgi:hypothetical protein
VVTKPSPISAASATAFGPEAGDEDRNGRFRQVVDARVLDRVVLAAVRLLPALPQRAHHLDRLAQHLEPHVRLRPVVAEDVLVERLAAADPEVEAPAGHDGARRRRLGDDRGVDADGGTGDAGGDRQVDGLGERADDGPHERAVALLVVPGVVVVGDPERVEARLLGPLGLLDEIPGPELLTGEKASDLHGAVLYP